jgi:predicted nucleic acid-binding protein
MKVVIDSNFFISRQFRLSGPHMTILVAGVSLGAIKVVVPLIVFEEVLNKFRERLSDLNSDLSRSVSKANEILAKEFHLQAPAVDLDAASGAYKKSFEKLISDLKAEVPTYKDIPQVDLVVRDLQRRRPFQDSGKGFRDALIWETILRYVLAPDIRCMLITSNTKDFCGEQHALHDHLQQDLTQRGYAADAVVVYSPQDSNEQLKNLLPADNNVQEAIAKDEYGPFDFNGFYFEQRDVIAKQLERQLESAGLSSIPRMVLEDANIAYLEDPQSWEIEDARQINAHHPYLEFRVKADANIHFFMDKRDFYSLDERYDFGIEDPDWNEYVMWLSKQVTLHFLIAIELSPGDEGIVDDFEVTLEGD